MRPVGIVVVYDVECPNCSAVARELPDLLRVPVRVRSCRAARLADDHPGLPAAVRSGAAPALGTVRRDGTVRWWPGLTGALGVLPLLRPSAAREAAGLLWEAARTHRRRRARAASAARRTAPRTDGQPPARRWRRSGEQHYRARL